MLLLTRLRQLPAVNNKENRDAAPAKEKKRQVTVMEAFRVTATVQRTVRRLASIGGPVSKQGARAAAQIRIQLEETKRKVRSVSPSALQFIGPGDHNPNSLQKGGGAQ